MTNERGEKEARLERLEAAFDWSGGRGVELADEIDALRAELNPEEQQVSDTNEYENEFPDPQGHRGGVRVKFTLIVKYQTPGDEEVAVTIVANPQALPREGELVNLEGRTYRFHAPIWSFEEREIRVIIPALLLR